jgi:uncharacterized damage-inducible protein DinB
MSYFDDLNEHLYELHADITKAIESLPIKALDWVPGLEMNSIAVLVIHLTGAERYWIGVALYEPPDRDRGAEFRIQALSADILKTHLVSADDYARLALARFSLPDLEAVCQSPRNAKTFSVGWCLSHALEHTALHTGHIQLTRQLWDQKEK